MNMKRYMNKLKPKYRIVKDRWNGFEAQQKLWWWPFWEQIGFTNTHTSIKDARNYIEEHLNNERTRWVEYYKPKEK